MTRDYKRETFLLVTPVVLILLLSLVTPVLVQAEDVDTEENDYIVRAPIRINGNDDFAAQAADEGWPGDGSEEDPYVIEGYEINGTGHGYGIYVGNTSVHFVVRDCYIHNVTGKDGTQEQNTGIYLYKVQNGGFEDNILYNKFGFVLWHSENNLIHNNTITGVVGVDLWYSDYNTISNNYIYCTVDDHLPAAGIALSGSEHNIIAYNHISGFKFGIDVSYRDTLGVNEYHNNTFVDVEYEIHEGVPVYNNNSNYSVLAYIGITIIITIIICLFLYKRRANKTNKGE